MAVVHSVPIPASLQRAGGSRKHQRLQQCASARHPLSTRVSSSSVEGMEDMAMAPDEADEKQSEMYSSHSRLRYPLAAIVGQNAIKTALLLGAVDTGMGGLAIAGRRGTGKTTMARGLQSIMPPIEVVAGSYANSDPNNPAEWETALEESAERDEQGRVKTRVRSAPFVQIPLGVTEDRLIGTVDIEESMRTGRTTFQPGLLAEAHRGILYVDDINLLDEGVCNLLLSVLANGVNVVEREGISIQHPCRPLLVATFNPDEGDVRDHLLDRIAISLSADQELSFDDRISAVDRATQFQDDAFRVSKEAEETTEQLRTQILFAREWLNGVSITDEQIEYLINECIRGRVQGHRAEYFAIRAAKALAALDSRDEVSAEDLKRAVQLVIMPRADQSLMNQDEDQEQPPPPPPPPSSSSDEDEQQEQEQDNTQDQQQSEEEEQEEQEEQEEEEDEEDEEGEADSPQVPEEFVFEAEGVEMEEDVMQFANQQNANTGMSGRSKNLIFSDERGRYVKAISPQTDTPKRVAVDATLRSAAPFQKMRREQAEDKDRRVYVEKSDFKQKKLARKAGALVVFLVDASGSMALNRMNSAKGAALRLLNESYMNRDQVCIIPFRGERAEVLLPPSRSVAMAKNRLDTMPCGGGSPLAHGLEVAALQGMNAMKRGDVGRVMIVMLSDGRGNIPLAKSKGQESQSQEGEQGESGSTELSQNEIKQEILDTARNVGSFGFNFLAIDTENKFVSSGLAKDIAQAANGKYYYLPNANDQRVAEATSQALSEIRQS